MGVVGAVGYVSILFANRLDGVAWHHPSYLVASVACGAMVRRWWAPLLGVAAAFTQIGIESDEPLWLLALIVVWPVLAAALAVGVMLGRAMGAALRRAGMTPGEREG
jgi:ABC-type uncharacterized transport system permease subunit